MRKVQYGDLTWYNFRTLGEADVKYLERKFKFHPLDLDDLRLSNQRPKLDEYESYLFIIFHAPYFDRTSRRLVQEEVNVFIGQNFLVTIHSGKLKILNELFEECRRGASRRAEYMGKGSGFLLYELISRLFEHSLPMLDKVAARINTVEQEILAGKSKEMVEELSHLKLEIINFRRTIRPQRQLIESLEAKNKKFLPERLDVYFDDVRDTIGRTSDLLETYKEVVESLEDTNETFIQHRINNVVKVLTIISLITLPGATISGLLAMNVRYPFAVNEITFYAVVTFSILTALTLLGYMFAKKWL